MRTLAKECFRKDWINRKSQSLHTGNTFLEKSLHAFELLGRLQEEGLDFVFKGGTSLLLRLPNPKRLSIDIDVLSQETPERLEKILGKCVSSPFTGYEEDKKRVHKQPPRRRHWNFHYDTIDPKSPKQYVILDVLDEKVLYSDVEEVDIKTSFIETNHDIRVSVPSIDNLLADKLTAFAPNTIGQKYDEEYPEKMVKHLFDIGELFNWADSIHTVMDVYERIAKTEIGYREKEKKIVFNECLDDTVETARIVSGLSIDQKFHSENSSLIRQGIDQLRGHLMGVGFSARDAAVAAAKSAYLATAIKNGRKRSFGDIRFDNAKVASLKGKTLNKFPELNKVLQASPEAFYYWQLADEISKEVSI
ncbi:MAG TPA: hypothetical protein DET40_01730 [Lentisphaeria bacterium]|nr:MAG: hypothetical protein A2X45_16990 [Lentisphaerae bacterium GWF2_50_93]HCE42253.1 hypothetical protein [Lentisphaeria bacterium]